MKLVPLLVPEIMSFAHSFKYIFALSLSPLCLPKSSWEKPWHIVQEQRVLPFLPYPVCPGTPKPARATVGPTGQDKNRVKWSWEQSPGPKENFKWKETFQKCWVPPWAGKKEAKVTWKCTFIYSGLHAWFHGCSPPNRTLNSGSAHRKGK